jgi:hypothetical protein
MSPQSGHCPPGSPDLRDDIHLGAVDGSIEIILGRVRGAH